MEYLKHNTKNYRTLRPSKVIQYASIMKRGEWQLTSEGIAFYENGDLANGQHRLNAIVKSNVTVPIYVTFDVPNDAKEYDRGMKRSSGDILKHEGFSKSVANNSAASTVTFLYQLHGEHYVSDEMLIQFIKRYEVLIENSLRIASSGKAGAASLCLKAPITTALFCAIFCQVPLSNLERFIKVVHSGFSDGMHESAAIVLRNFLQDTKANGGNKKIKFTTLQEKKRLFAFATNAINDFANMNYRQKAYPESVKPQYWEMVNKHLIW